MAPEETTEDRSARVRLARIAERVIALNSEVAPSAGIGRWYTGDGAERIVGVVAGETAAGTVDLDLHLALFWPPPQLDSVADALRSDLRAEAERDGLAERLGEVDIHVVDILERKSGDD